MYCGIKEYLFNKQQFPHIFATHFADLPYFKL